MATGLGLMIAGHFIFVGSLVFAVINMARQTKNISSSSMKMTSSNSGKMFTRHIGATVGMVLGGGMFLIGLIMMIVQKLSY